LSSPAERLPDGAMIAAGADAFVVVAGRPLIWSPDGYRPVTAFPPIDGLLTPPSTLGALRAGYRPELHPSVQ
jgi:hypothetical protein